MESAKARGLKLLLMGGELSLEARDFACVSSLAILLEDMVVMILTTGLYIYKVSIRAYV